MTVDNGYSIKSDENLSCVLHKANDLRLENCPLPDKPKKNGKLLIIYANTITKSKQLEALKE